MRRPRPPQGLGDCLRYCREVDDYLATLEDLQAPNTLVHRTTKGTSRTALGGGDGQGESTGLVFKGQWEPGSYDEGDIVRRNEIPEMDDGTVAGTYIALEDVTASDVPPGEAATAATFETEVGGGQVVNGFVIDGGSGYLVTPSITIVGDGTGATGHVTVVDGVITSVVMDTLGSGYTVASITVDDPTGTQKWDLFATFHTPRFTIITNDKRITIDSGRDADADPSFMIYKDLNDEEAGSIQLDVAAIFAISGAGNYVIKLREWDVCVDGVPQRAIFLSSEPYDPPA